FVARRARRDMGDDAAAKLTLTLLPLTDLHLALPSDRQLIATLEIAGLLTLVIAIVNYVNLSTAQAGLRAREVALRKIVGATQPMLVSQFLAEAMAMAMVALLVGLALAEMALPWINAASGATIRLVYVGVGSVMPGAILLAAAVGLLAGWAPALLLSRFQPAAVLASVRAPGGGRAGRRARQVLVVGQFTITIALAISTAVLVGQAEHLRRSDLGFVRDGLMLIPSFADPGLDPTQRDRLRAVLGALPGVKGITRSSEAPAEQRALNISVIGRPGAIVQPGAVGKLPTVHIVSVAPDFFAVYRAKLLAGRLFDDRHATDAIDDTDFRTLTAAEHGVVVTSLAATRLGFATPDQAIGQRVQIGFDTALRIIGVIGDIRFGSPREPMPGSVYLYYPHGPATQIAALRYADADPRVLLAAAESAWRQVAPAVPFDAQTAAAQLDDAFYITDMRRARLFTTAAGLAMIIGCIGLYGLAAFDTARRVKEIGIRKTIGASTAEVLRLLIGQFMRPVLLANLVAWPLAYVAMRRWLAGFDDRIALSPLFFVGATLVAMLIAAATVFGQAWRVARAEPARALRHE
ncbi:FtsX-like permease family protein, partial [Sphingomonas sp. GC_Shp_4]